jgi:hypothetical protein
VLADLRGTAFNAKQMRQAGVCALWADDNYECAFKHRARPDERCSICKKPLRKVVPANESFPFRVIVDGKREVACSPRCAFDLGAKLAPYGRREE